jgi:CRP/FNR family transcriptional regulator
MKTLLEAATIYRKRQRTTFALTAKLKLVPGNGDGAGCADCKRRPACLPAALPRELSADLATIIRAQPSMAKHTVVYREGGRCETLYAVRMGSMKNTVTAAAGQQSVIGFRYPGEIAGLDSVGQHRYASSAVTLERSALCAIPIAALKGLCQRRGMLVRRVFEVMGAATAGEGARVRILRCDEASRLAAFLLDSAGRVERERPLQECRLSVQEADIASYLGLSRTAVREELAHLHEVGLVRRERDRLQFMDLEGLREYHLAQGRADRTATQR